MAETIKVIPTELSDVKILEPRVFADARGFFYESYNMDVLSREAGIRASFVQDNHSRSYQNVLRGLHYQIDHPQGKLVRVVSGEVYDVAVDLRKSSPTCGQWIGRHLLADKQQLLWIPPGFAHGFLVLSPQADFLYKTTDFYDPHSEYCLRWNDPDIGIAWPIQGPPLLSAKDANGKSFKEASLFP